MHFVPMALTLCTYDDYANAVGVTKADVQGGGSDFMLDFSRRLHKVKWLGFANRWVGVIAALEVPVVHLSETHGEFAVTVPRGDPRFKDIQTLWRKHFGTTRTLELPPIGELEVIADFAKHFHEDCPRL